MAMVTAVQEAQRDNLRSFDTYMMKVVEVSEHSSFLFFKGGRCSVAEDPFVVIPTSVNSSKQCAFWNIRSRNINL